MRILLTFRTDNLRLPLAGNAILQGFIYRLLSEQADYGDFLHDGGYRAGHKIFKLFLFRPLAGRYAVEGKEILFPSEASLELRSPDPAFTEACCRVCRPGREFGINGQTVVLSGCSLLPAPKFAENAPVRMESPLTVHTTDGNGHTRCYSPYEDRFYELVAANARRKWESFRGAEPFSFAIEPAAETDFRRLVTTFKGIYVTAWYGKFRLSGTPEVLDFLYHCGLGARNSQGFGMFCPEAEKE